MKVAVSPFGAPSNNSISPFNKVWDNVINPNFLPIAGCDALLLWGGTDVSSCVYNEQPHRQHELSGSTEPTYRDKLEWHWCREAYEQGIPIVGVCRGAQLLSCFAGGSIIQHVNNHLSGHQVHTYDGKLFHAPANHHQMMHIDKTNYELLAWAVDNAIIYEGEGSKTVERELTVDPEVVWFPDIKGFAIQPHPEWGPAGTEFNNWVLDQLNNHLYKV